MSQQFQHLIIVLLSAALKYQYYSQRLRETLILEWNQFPLGTELALLLPVLWTLPVAYSLNAGTVPAYNHLHLGNIEVYAIWLTWLISCPIKKLLHQLVWNYDISISCVIWNVIRNTNSDIKYQHARNTKKLNTFGHLNLEQKVLVQYQNSRELLN